MTLLLLACVPPPAPPREPVDEVDPTVRAHSATSAADHTHLWATNRSAVFEIEVGIAGRHVLRP